MPTYDRWIEPSVTITPDTSIYTANDVIGDHPNATTGALTFSLETNSATGVIGSSSGGGLINKLIVYDNDNEGAAGALWLFKADLATPILDQATFAPVLADWDNWITTITLPAFTTYNSIKQALVTDINDQFRVSQNKIYGYFVCSGTPTYASSKSLVFKLGILTQ